MKVSICYLGYTGTIQFRVLIPAMLFRLMAEPEIQVGDRNLGTMAISNPPLLSKWEKLGGYLMVLCFRWYTSTAMETIQRLLKLEI